MQKITQITDFASENYPRFLSEITLRAIPPNMNTKATGSNTNMKFGRATPININNAPKTIRLIPATNWPSITRGCKRMYKSLQSFLIRENQLLLQFLTKFTEDVIFPPNTLVPYDLAFTKPLSSNQMQFYASMGFRQPMFSAEFIFAIIAFKRQICLYTAIIAGFHFRSNSPSIKYKSRYNLLYWHATSSGDFSLS